jgi:homopolymeric O-antigen transport system ATP-binding protein
VNQPIISVENLSKAYRIGLKEDIPDTFVAAMTGWLKAPLRNWRRLRRLNTFAEPVESGEWRVESQKANGNGDTTHHSPLTTHQSDTLWALRNVSFEVHEGEVVGIIGRNGAGKSTLLKVLSRITEPTHGRAVIRGRVSSLLEVGTGFHPELTGRENIYMNGTILGMRKREIDRKFDEIVDFSGVEKFLDTPIKRYSSGMQVRLAFAVAAHLEPEILIIDEVLAVGDATFQKKCLGKMKDVSRTGRTVLFVSHNLSIIRQLCERSVVLRDGALVYEGDVDGGVARYSSEQQSPSFDNYKSTTRVFIGSARLVPSKKDLPSAVERGGSLQVRVDVVNSQSDIELSFGASVETESFMRIMANCTLSNDNGYWCRPGTTPYLLKIPDLPLNQGVYHLTLALHDHKTGATIDRHDQCLAFEVIESESATGVAVRRKNDGIVICGMKWESLRNT